MVNYNDTPAYMSGASGGGPVDIGGWLASLFGGNKKGGTFAGTNNPAPAKYSTPAYMSGAKGGSADIQPAPQAAAPADWSADGGGGDFSHGVSGSFQAAPNNTMQLGSQAQSDPLLDMLKASLNSDPYSSGPYMDNLNQARSSSLAALAGARDTTQKNFDQSNQAIGDLYAKGRQDTLAQAGTLKESNDNLQSGLSGMYNNATKTLQDDRSQEMGQKAEMMQRLGIQAGGLGTAGDTQTQAIANNVAEQTAQGAKAQQYGAADQTANTSRANGLISEGSARQGELRSQLSGILSQLTNKELDVNNNYANQSMNARNQSYQDWLGKNSSIMSQIDKRDTLNQNAQKNILQSRLLSTLVSGGKGGGGAAGNASNLDNANSYVQSQGLNPADYNNAYTQAMLEGRSSMPGTAMTEQDLLQEMHSKHPNLDANQLIAYIRNASAKGDYSPSSSSGLSPQIQSMLMGMG